MADKTDKRCVPLHPRALLLVVKNDCDADERSTVAVSAPKLAGGTLLPVPYGLYSSLTMSPRSHSRTKVAKLRSFHYLSKY